jgi:transcriptional regulator GlxA family with amidase domain
LLELRLERAKALLDGARMPIRTIGSMVGFPDISHFSRFFKAATGYSPSEYRALRSGAAHIAAVDRAEEE